MKWLSMIASFLVPAIAYAGQCPWKAAELEREIGAAIERVAGAWRVADERDREIAQIRRAAILDCQGGDTRARLERFTSSPGALDLRSEVATGDLLLTCVDEKRAEAQKRIEAARKLGNRTLERRLLEVSASIDQDAPRALDHQISVNQLASKVARLDAERERLIGTCELSDF